MRCFASVVSVISNVVVDIDSGQIMCDCQSSIPRSDSWFNKNEKYLRSQGQNKTIITRSVILAKQWTADDGQYVRDQNAVSIITSITTKMKIIVLNNEGILIITHFKGENSSTI